MFRLSCNWKFTTDMRNRFNGEFPTAQMHSTMTSRLTHEIQQQQQQQQHVKTHKLKMHSMERNHAMESTQKSCQQKEHEKKNLKAIKKKLVLSFNSGSSNREL
jgi:hypothetical protein